MNKFFLKQIFTALEKIPTVTAIPPLVEIKKLF
jgi:hypothetical protein